MFVFRSIPVLTISFMQLVMHFMPLLATGSGLYFYERLSAAQFSKTLALLRDQVAISLHQKAAALPDSFAFLPGTPSHLLDLAMLGILWVAIGGLFLKSQFYQDRLNMRLMRFHQTSGIIQIKSLVELGTITFFNLLLGPIMLITSLFQQPSYAYVSQQAHYRDRLYYVTGKNARLEQDANLVFDSRALFLSQILEIALISIILYAVCFEGDFTQLVGQRIQEILSRILPAP